MSKIDEYRAQAAYCVSMAEKDWDTARRERWRAIAQTWLALAQSESDLTADQAAASEADVQSLHENDPERRQK